MRRRTKNNKKTPAERARDLFSLLKALILIGILCGIPAYILLCHREVLSNLNSLHDVLTLFRSHSEQSAVLYLGAQILQIVISVLPGQIFQIAAGYIFGFLPGLLLSLIGAAAGTTVTYFLAYILGKDAMFLILGKEKSEKLVNVLNGEKAYLIVFLLYLIPGMPKDLCCYVAGVSDMKFRPFLILSVVGRTPAMCMSLLYGVMYLHHYHLGMGIIAGTAGVLLLLLLLFRKKLMALFDRFYRRITAEKQAAE